MENRRDASHLLTLADQFAQAHDFSQKIKAQPSLGLYINCSLSIKAGHPTVFDTEEAGLFFIHIPPKLFEDNQTIWLKRDTLVDLAKLDDLPGPQLLEQIQLCRLQDSPFVVSQEVLLHAVVSAKVTAITHPSAVLSILHTRDYQERMAAVYGGSLLTLEKGTSILSFARHTAKGSGLAPECMGVAIPGYGLLVFGETPDKTYQTLIQFVGRAEKYLDEQKARKPTLELQTEPDDIQVNEISALRQAISSAAGFPVIVCLDKSQLTLRFAGMASHHPERLNPVLGPHAATLRLFPLLGRDLQAYLHTYTEIIQANVAENQIPFDKTPRVILDPKLGTLYIGRSAEAAAEVQAIHRANMQMILLSSALGSCSPVPTSELVENDLAGRADGSTKPAGNQYMTGEVALVTGAASGIGKACVESLLARGAAVVGLDINPVIENLFLSPSFLGICLDITDEDAIRSARLKTIRRFGGLDMLVLNAGVFPPGCRIDALTFDSWDKVRRVNLDANLFLMREAFPLLKAAPHHGRVVIVGSRNQRAPGPGAAAYSVSKAAVTQLARVAALEWGGDQIRVNVIHPDSVFDTALYTDEILKNRSAMYGMTVDEYKRRNVLKVEITSHDIGEMAAEMCGPLFSKITGAQIPLDGGNERVI